MEETNEQIVELIRQGRTDLYLELWNRLRRFIGKMAYKRIVSSRGFNGNPCGGVEIEDLIQAGYLAMTEAVKTYDPAEGMFNTWLGFYLRKAFNEAQGIRHGEGRAIDKAVSLDKPIYEDSDETLLDMVASTLSDGRDDYEAADDKIYNDELRAALERALDEIPEGQAKILRRTELDNKTYREAGEEIGVSKERVRQLRRDGINSLRQNRGLRLFLQDQINYYLHVSKETFNSTHQSSTELLALRRIELEQKTGQDYQIDGPLVLTNT